MSANAGLSEVCFTNLDANGFDPKIELADALMSEIAVKRCRKNDQVAFTTADAVIFICSETHIH